MCPAPPARQVLDREECAVSANSFIDAFRLGFDATKESDQPVRVAVYIDRTASPFLVSTVREALVPETTSALVRVEPLASEPANLKPDTDIVLVLSCGSDCLEEAVRNLVIAGAPVCVIAESSIEAPFIEHDTPLLGLIAANERDHLLNELARWILDRTEKDAAFAASFPFMREAASTRIITSTAIANMATGALVFIPGADYPVMTLAQIGMALKLASSYGYKLAPERLYEVAGIAVSGLALRAVSRTVQAHAGHLGFVVKALVGGFGTYAMGRALASAYEHGIDYAPVNDALKRAAARVRSVVDVQVDIEGVADASSTGAYPIPAEDGVTMEVR